MKDSGLRFFALVVALALFAACDASKDPAGKDTSGSGGGGTSTTAAVADDPGEWPQWGRTPSKNMSATAKNLPSTFEPGEIGADDNVEMGTTENVLWVAKLGSQSYGNPTVSNGRVYVGTNIEGRGDPRFKGDHSILKCLDEKTGKVIWTLTVPKLGSGKVGDWELLGICSSATIAGDRVYVITNRCEVLALDVNGMADGNQGSFQDEARYMAYAGPLDPPPAEWTPVEIKPTDADIIWRYDMREELGIYPHNITSSSPLIVGDYLICSTSNGVTYDHTDIPAPKAPALVALNRKVAEREDATPAEILYGEEGEGISKRVLHGNWTSPGWGTVNGVDNLLYGGPDGILYCFNPEAVKDEDGFGVFPLRWQFDCNPLTYRYKDGDKSQPIKYVKPEGPSEIISTPVFYKGRVYAPIGQDPEHGEGIGNLVCLDVATGKQVWEFRGIKRAISTCSIVDDLVYVADYSGFLYCVDANDGKLYWRFDTMSPIWGSTLVADGKVFLGNEDGVLTIMSTGEMKKLADEMGAPIYARIKSKKFVVAKDEKIEKPLKTLEGEAIKQYYNAVEFSDPIHASPIVANDVLYVCTMRHLYAIKADGK